uniref:MSP domain-containing protein n=1 Tax=Heterorhabditis bacteriophora TaxID=37862 RepID=A0A1I7X663_HETBA
MDEFQLHCKVKTKYELELCIFLSAGTSSSRKVLFPPKTPHYQPDAPEPMCTRFVLRAQVTHRESAVRLAILQM